MVLNWTSIITNKIDSIAMFFKHLKYNILYVIISFL